jgi:hypothetical protein
MAVKEDPMKATFSIEDISDIHVDRTEDGAESPVNLDGC